MRKVLNGDIPGKRSQRLLNMERRQWGKCWMMIYEAKDHRDYWTWTARNEESAEWWYTRQRSQRLLNMERMQWGKCWMVIYQAKDHRDYWTWTARNEESAEWWYTRQRSQRLLNMDRMQWGKCWMMIYQAKDHRHYWTWSTGNEKSAEWWYTRQEITETIEHGAQAMRKVLNGDIPGKRSQRLLNMDRTQWGKCWMMIYQAKDHRDYWTWTARNEESAEWWYTRQNITETIEHGAQAMRKVLNGDIPGKRSQRLLNMECTQWGKCWMVIYQARDHRDYWTWSARNEDGAEWWYTRQKITETIEHGAQAMRKVLNGDIPGKDHRDYWTWSARNEESAEW